MMDVTDRHCRFFLRQISRHTKTLCPGALAVLRMEFAATDSVLSIVIAVQPETSGRSRLYRLWARNDIVGDEERWAECLRNEAPVLAEDLSMFAAFRHHRLALDLLRRRDPRVQPDRERVRGTTDTRAGRTRQREDRGFRVLGYRVGGDVHDQRLILRPREKDHRADRCQVIVSVRRRAAGHRNVEEHRVITCWLHVDGDLD